MKEKGAAPAWLMEELRQARRGRGKGYIQETGDLLARLGLSTVCDSARCPNRGDCYSHHTATFLILGDVCTRGCTFCAVRCGRPKGPPDPGEPDRLADALSLLSLTHVVITSVTRDDLSDGGASHYAHVVRTLRRRCPGVKIELLIPDFLGSRESLLTVLEAGPDILAHNVETVPRLYRTVRRGADYSRSLVLLKWAKLQQPDLITKSGFMLGLGETEDEIRAVLCDLAEMGCDMATIGQYLAPSLAHAPVDRYALPEEYRMWRLAALDLGFKSVAAGPLVRSSYKASQFFGEIA